MYVFSHSQINDFYIISYNFVGTSHTPLKSGVPWDTFHRNPYLTAFQRNSLYFSVDTATGLQESEAEQMVDKSNSFDLCSNSCSDWT